MTAGSPVFAGTANSGAGQMVGRKRQPCRFLDVVMRSLHELYPVKTAANIAARTGAHTRSAERWISRERDMNAESFIALLCGQDGDKIIEALMTSLPARERPRWWIRHCNSARWARLQVLQAERDEEIRQLRLDMSR